MATLAVARAADALTLLRLGIAVSLVFVLATGRLELGAVMLVFGWTTDTFDGVLARRAPGMTRLGPWDATIDAMVGLGLIVGLVAGGYTPAVWLVPEFAFAVLLLFFRSAASGMLLQGVAYGWFLRILADESGAGLVVMLAGIAAAAILHGQRVPRVLLPKFFADVARLRRSGRSPGGHE